ncbi:hypothetical protein Tco_0139814 [Tanacetum coccineum]
MMTYLKHVGNKKHADLKTKSFDEIKALYEKVKRFDDSFITIGSTEDERKIKEMNEGASDPDKKKKFVKEDVSAKVPAKQDVAEQGTKKRKGGHMKMIARKRKRPQPDVDSDDKHIKCLKIVTFEGTIDSEIMERKSFISKLDKVSSPEGDYLVVYRVNGNFRAFNYLMEVLHIFDRQDLFHLYDLVMKQYSESTPEGIELILWGDLKIMMESSIEVTDQGDFWNDQQDWEIVTWRLYEACGVCILEFKDGTVIHMLVERKYPLSKELLQRMLDFGLEVEVESTAALDLIRVLNSPCFMVKSWLVQDQTVLGKDYSNLLIADSLLKTIWFINAPCYGNEALASPKANGVWMWPTCDPDSKFCFGYNEVFGVNEQGTLRLWICFRDHERRTMKGSYMGFADFLQVRYGQQNIDDTTRERRIGHNNLHESDREFIFNEWILDSYDVKEEYAREIGNPYSRRFDEYNRVFNNEIEHLSNEYILRIGKKGYVLDDVWEKCQQNYKKTNEAWHDEGYEEDEMWQSGDEKTDYDPPYDEALRLGHVNGARFKAMIRKELEGNKSFDDYKWEFNLEIDKLANEYELGIGKKEHILDNIWEYCNQVHNKNYEWHNYEFENEECEEIGIEDKDYHPPEVQVETFEVKKYSFEGGQSFICVTKDLDNILPLGRKNGSKFKEMIRKEVENNKT